MPLDDERAYATLAEFDREAHACVSAAGEGTAESHECIQSAQDRGDVVLGEVASELASGDPLERRRRQVEPDLRALLSEQTINSDVYIKI